ncbi:unnamed protein product [Prorocentrum cordatum]|uniref:PH domain-containing protein n=1 Tax=Prorocentrum cordatum TaxID=2364126 RepID=A0ABN9X386_9DINO|nr:unnamed protein product [Polarella glacialis]
MRSSMGACAHAALFASGSLASQRPTLLAAMSTPEIIINREDIIKEGYLVKQSKHFKEWRNRWFVLTPQYLCSFKEQGILRNPTEAIRLRECCTVKSADEDTGREHSFRVDTPGRVFYLIAQNSTEKEAWIGHVGRMMVRPTVLTEEEEQYD